ncbi:MAG: D-aminopeptidase [Candidatus Celerinatantimonas neptuna]|nr:MAG: D-aminopeptidase [Candidatus Celerinatantimonas neptuna]
MNIFISADIEGIAGVVASDQCQPGHAEHELARALMEDEVNAAIAGAFDGGATAVTVADSHANMTNLRAAYIDERASLVQSKPRPLSMVEGIEYGQYDGLFFIGYHSGVGQSGVLAHTINGSAFHRVMINDQAMAEADIYAAAAAEYQTPLWLVSGDDQLQGWIGEYYPTVEYACVKRMISTTAAQSLSPAASQKLIHEKARMAVEKAVSQKTTRIKPPYTLELTVTKPVMADVYALIPGVKQTDARTVSFVGSDMKEIVSLLSVFSYLARAC